MQFAFVQKLLSILVYIVDVCTDYQTGATYWQNGDVWWGSLTIGIALVHSFISTVYLLRIIYNNSGKYQFIWPAAHFLRRILTVAICCSGFGPVLIIVDSLIDHRRKKVDPFKEKISVNLSILALIEAIPQSCLQSYILIQKTMSPPTICKPMKLGYATINATDNGQEFLKQMSMIEDEVSGFPNTGGCITFDNMEMLARYRLEKTITSNVEECKHACLSSDCNVFVHEKTGCQLRKLSSNFKRHKITERRLGIKLGKCFKGNNVTYRDMFHGVVVTGQMFDQNGNRLYDDPDENMCLLHFNGNLSMVAPEFFLNRETSPISVCYTLKKYLLQMFSGTLPVINVLPLVNMLTSIISASFILSTKIQAPALLLSHDRMMQNNVIKVSSNVFGFLAIFLGLLHVLVWFGLTALMSKAVAFVCLPIMAWRLFIPAVLKGKFRPFAGWSLQLGSVIVVCYLAMNPDVVYSNEKHCPQMIDAYNLTTQQFYKKWDVGSPKQSIGYMVWHISKLLPDPVLTSEKMYLKFKSEFKSRPDLEANTLLRFLLTQQRNALDRLITALHDEYGVKLLSSSCRDQRFSVQNLLKNDRTRACKIN